MAFDSPTAAFTAADLVAAIPEIWSPIVNEPKFPKAVLSNFCMDLSEFMVAGGDIVHVPDIYTNQFTVGTQSTQGAGVVDSSPTSVDTTLTVNTHKYVAWIIGDKDMAQLATKYRLNEKYAREAQNLLVDALEDALAALWSSLSTNTVGDTATVLTDLEVRQSIEKLDTANFDLKETAFFVHPFVYWTQLSGITKYYDNQVSGFFTIADGNFGPLADPNRGLKGVLYDIPVFTTSNIVSSLQTYRNMLLHKSALGFAVQTNGMQVPQVSAQSGEGSGEPLMAPGKVRVQAQYLLQNLGTLVVADIIYGVAALREGAGVAISASITATTA